MAEFPRDPCLMSLKIVSYQPTRVSVSQSLKREVLTTGSQRWAISGEFPSMTRTQAKRLIAFINDQRGRAGTFQFVLPLESSTHGDATSRTVALVLNGDSYPAGTSSLAVLGNDSALLPGDFVKFANHEKVYMLGPDTSETILHVIPNLMQSVANNELVIYDDVPFTVALANDSQEYSVDIGQLYGQSISMVEVF